MNLPNIAPNPAGEASSIAIYETGSGTGTETYSIFANLSVAGTYTYDPSTTTWTAPTTNSITVNYTGGSLAFSPGDTSSVVTVPTLNDHFTVQGNQIGSALISGGGTLVVNGSFSGSASIGPNATFELGGTDTGMITFAGANATLKIDGTSMPSNVITGFAPGDIIDLTGVSYNFREFTQLQNWANNQLTIFSTGVGSPTYQLNLDPSASYFGDWVELSPDGRGGTDLQLVPVNSVQINIAESGNGYGTLSATVNGQIIPGMQGTVYCANDDLMPVPAGDYTVNYRTNAHSSGNADVLEFPSSQISYARNVQIHLGNTPGDSAGCIVFGDGYVPDASHYNAGSWTALASFMDSITSPNMNSAGYFAAPVPIKVNVSGVTSQPTLQIVPSSTTVSRGASDSIDFTVVGLTPSSPIIDKDINVYFQVTGTTATQSLITGATPVSHTDQGVALPPGCFKVTIVGSGQNNDPPGTADVAVTLNTAGVSTSNLTIKIVHYDGVSEETNCLLLIMTLQVNRYSLQVCRRRLRSSRSRSSLNRFPTATSPARPSSQTPMAPANSPPTTPRRRPTPTAISP